jgi:hypothetical protein
MRETEVEIIAEVYMKVKFLGKVKDILLWGARQSNHLVRRFPGFARLSF